MRKVFILLFVCLCFNLFSIEGAWELNNFFMLTIHDGKIGSFQPIQLTPIVRFNILNDRNKTNFVSVRIVIRNNNYEKAINTTCFDNSNDKMPVIYFYIEEHNDLFLELNLVKVDNNKYWYSFNIKYDEETDKYLSVQDDNNNYLNFIGIMQKIF